LVYSASSESNVSARAQRFKAAGESLRVGRARAKKANSVHRIARSVIGLGRVLIATAVFLLLLLWLS
jgi:hypothetical protein